MKFVRGENQENSDRSTGDCTERQKTLLHLNFSRLIFRDFLLNIYICRDFCNFDSFWQTQPTYLAMFSHAPQYLCTFLAIAIEFFCWKIYTLHTHTASSAPSDGRDVSLCRHQSNLFQNIAQTEACCFLCYRCHLNLLVRKYNYN